ncbi:adenylate/guanylate cyclase domain-containing protein [Fulvivirga lutimaris]|uniref:adenylate/guanylate cyclase domain-containing protein n=1 Tax=Fulvivirga lutimaris TaxID=1819566 RepID=UPI0012BD30B5|nr:adenylate/guanylate cyclase domain-containing protein [Fulvivirga lutimaris]MTI39597.1 adenylate/guanylate cyclase domain-containing protein [Fulvivirga lutimaris]
MTPKQKHNLQIILRFTAFWTLFGTLYGIVEYGLLGETGLYPSTQNVYGGKSQIVYVIVGAGLLGAVVGTMEVFFFKNLFLKKPFVFKVIFKSAFYSILILIFLIVLGAIFTSHRLNKAIIDAVVIQSQMRFISNFAFFSIFIYIGFAFFLSFFIFEMSKSMGIMVVYNFITGKYHKPSIEDRIFMFIDMKGSTTIAEKLGHVKYYELLNKYYADMSDPILNSQGEIYQYVGDEIIISWPKSIGIKNNNCLNCFYDIRDNINLKSSEYFNAFSLVPQFKAGLHCGPVTTGEIGQLKKEIVFTGDVLNTTSRIQMLCNEYNAQLLASQQVLDLLTLNNEYDITPMGEIQLKGKNRKINISTVAK